jgi:nuclear pore complex protein Nup98-Nup96
MFGGNAVQSTWGQQNQQPQQPGSAFGQPSAFGSGGAFGQNQQQQQPAANPMFGNLGTPSTTAGTSGGFGAFGNTNNNNNATNPLFGGAKPATGFGAFGGGGNTSTFGSGGATFGSTTNNATAPATSGTGLFGQPTNNASTGSAFGGGLFGNKPATTAFGSTPANNNGTYDSVAPVTTGTAGTPFSPFNEKDSANANITLQYQSITAMPAYRGSSFEELRVQDYQQGRKTAGGFGQSATFPAQASTSTSGTTGLFGQPAQPAANPMFGGSAFGANNTNQPNANTSGGFGAFGQNTAGQTNTAGTGTGTGIFGSFAQNQQQQQQQPSTGFGAFGQPQQPQPATGTGTSIFGGGGAFGQNKPAGGAFNAFSNPSGTSAFGGSGAFGNNQPQQQQPATGGLFGQPQQNTGAFGALGNNNNAAKPSIFGQPAQPTTQPTTGFGQFGQQQNQQQGQQPAAGGGLFGGGIFGQNNQQQQTQQQPNQQQPGGLFSNPPANQPAGGGLFGGGNLFGTNGNQQQNQQQPAQNTGFNLFNKPAAPAAPSGGLFGNNPFGQTGTNSTGGQQQQPSIFGNTLGQSTNQQSGTGTGALASLWSKPAAPALGQSQSQSGGGLFSNTGTLNATATAPGAQGSLTASIAEPMGANLPIFSMLPPGPRAVTLEQQPKKKPGFFVDVPTRSPVPRLQLGYTPANAKLRGFASEQLWSSMSFSSGKPNALSLSRADGKAPGGPDGFLGRSSSPGLGSGGRQSVKKLILDKKVEPSDLFNKSGSPGLRGSPGKVTFNPAMSQAARERDIAREAANSPSSPSLNRQHSSPGPSPRPPHLPNHFSAHSTSHIVDPQGKVAPASDGESAELQEGDYWVKPDLDVLRRAGYNELSSYSGVVVGRVGYGEIHFLDPVDLTGLSKLDELKGQVVRFDDKECTVYPDSDDADKPSPGTGLNVRARIVLVRCWAVDKATREPIKDENHPSAVKHLKRLKNMRDTHFESFDLSEGKWTFTVDHF